MIVEKYCKECGGKIMGIALAASLPVYKEQCMGCGRVVRDECTEIIKEFV